MKLKNKSKKNIEKDIMNQKEIINETLSDYVKSKEKLLNLTYPDLKDYPELRNMSYHFWGLCKYIYIDDRYKFVWLVAKSFVMDSRSDNEPIGISFEDFAFACFAHLENKSIEDEMFGITSKCKNALDDLDSVLDNVHEDDKDKLVSLLSKISKASYLNRIKDQLDEKSYSFMEDWFSNIVTEVFEEFAPHFGLVENYKVKEEK